MHLLLRYFCLENSHAGRINPSMLSDQQLMELFFTPDDFDKAREALGGDEDDACSWEGVRCELNSNIRCIDWHCCSLRVKGAVSFEMLPPRLELLSLYSQELYGEINTTALPKQMECLCVQETFLSGTLDLGSLPRGLTEMTVEHNRISAIVNFFDLPEALYHFEIKEKNIVERSLHIGSLPEGDLEVDIEQCQLQNVTFANPADAKRVTF